MKTSIKPDTLILIFIKEVLLDQKRPKTLNRKLRGGNLSSRSLPHNRLALSQGGRAASNQGKRKSSHQPGGARAVRRGAAKPITALPLAHSSHGSTHIKRTYDSERRAAEAECNRLREELSRVAAKEPVNPKAVNRELSKFIKSPAVHLYHGCKVTQQNNGRSTPGADGIASVRPEDVPALVEGLASRLGETEGPGLIRRIPKPDGGERTITIFCTIDRIKAAVIADGLNAAFGRLIPANSFAFLLGRGHHAAIAAAANHLSTMSHWVWAVKLDIKGMFRSIDPAAAIKGLELNSYMERILETHTNVEVIDGGEKRRNEGLPEGSAISCVLANLYVRGWTDNLIGTAYGIGYADDFYMFGLLGDVEESAAKIETWLKEKALTLNEEKCFCSPVTAIYKEWDKIRFTNPSDVDTADGVSMLGVTLVHLLHLKPRPYVYINLDKYREEIDGSTTEEAAKEIKREVRAVRKALRERCNGSVHIDIQGRGLKRIPGAWKDEEENEAVTSMS